MPVGRPSSRGARSIFAEATALRRILRLWLTKAAGSVGGCTQAGEHAKGLLWSCWTIRRLLGRLRLTFVERDVGGWRAPAG
eukprot:9493517-Pyramimonas_sp.AAC.1